LEYAKDVYACEADLVKEYGQVHPWVSEGGGRGPWPHLDLKISRFPATCLAQKSCFHSFDKEK